MNRSGIRWNITLFILFLISLSFSSHSIAQEDDDFLLSIPAIIAGANKASTIDGLERVKELTGRWLYTWSNDFEEYYRFDGATAVQSPNDDSIYLIEGDSSLYIDYSGSPWCGGGMIGSYSSEFDSYIVLCNWGFPDFDLGSLYAFSAPSANFPLTHYFYYPSTGEVAETPTNGTGRKISSIYRMASPTANTELRQQELDAEKEARLHDEELSRQVAREFKVSAKVNTHLEKVLEAIKVK